MFLVVCSSPLILYYLVLCKYAQYCPKTEYMPNALKYRIHVQYFHRKHKRILLVEKKRAWTRVVTMHRCIAILGPAIRVLYRDLSIAIRIAIRITYRDQCIATRHTYHDATSGASRYVNAAWQRMYRNTSVHCPYHHRRLCDLFKNNQARILWRCVICSPWMTSGTPAATPKRLANGAILVLPLRWTNR